MTSMIQPPKRVSVLYQRASFTKADWNEPLPPQHAAELERHQRKQDLQLVVSRTHALPDAGIKEHLAKMPFFEGCATAFLARLFIELEMELYDEGEVIIAEGDIKDRMFCLMKGEVEILVGPEKKRVATAQEGSVLGELALYNHISILGDADKVNDERRNATVRAITFCDCRAISRSRFHSVLKMYPEELCRFINSYNESQEASRQLQATSRKRHAEKTHREDVNRTCDASPRGKDHLTTKDLPALVPTDPPQRRHSQIKKFREMMGEQKKAKDRLREARLAVDSSDQDEEPEDDREAFQTWRRAKARISEDAQEVAKDEAGDSLERTSGMNGAALKAGEDVPPIEARSPQDGSVNKPRSDMEPSGNWDECKGDRYHSWDLFSHAFSGCRGRRKSKLCTVVGDEEDGDIPRIFNVQDTVPPEPEPWEPGDQRRAKPVEDILEGLLNRKSALQRAFQQKAAAEEQAAEAKAARRRAEWERAERERAEKLARKRSRQVVARVVKIEEEEEEDVLPRSLRLPLPSPQHFVPQKPERSPPEPRSDADELLPQCSLGYETAMLPAHISRMPAAPGLQVLVQRCSHARLQDERRGSCREIGHGLVVHVSFFTGKSSVDMQQLCFQAARSLLNAKLSSQSGRQDPSEHASVLSLCGHGESQGLLIVPQVSLAPDIDFGSRCVTSPPRASKDERIVFLQEFLNALRTVAREAICIEHELEHEVEAEHEPELLVTGDHDVHATVCQGERITASTVPDGTCLPAIKHGCFGSPSALELTSSDPHTHHFLF